MFVLKYLLLKNHCDSYANIYTKFVYVVKFPYCKTFDLLTNTGAKTRVIKFNIDIYMGEMFRNLLFKITKLASSDSVDCKFWGLIRGSSFKIETTIQQSVLLLCKQLLSSIFR